MHGEIGDGEGAIGDRRRVIECLRTDCDTVDGEGADENLREIERLKTLIARRKS